MSGDAPDTTLDLTRAPPARADVPLELARVHWRTTPGQRVLVRALAGSEEPGWPRADLVDVVVGGGFVVVDVEADGSKVHGGGGGDGGRLLVTATRARSLPDTVGPGMRLLVCGLNPSEYAADRGVGYARPGNRFWSAALEAGLVTRSHDPLHALEAHGVGMTDLVKRATPRASLLGDDEFRAGAARAERLVRRMQPRAVCFVGLSGWRAAVDGRAVAGLQPQPFAGRPAYVMPSTSGLNAHASRAELVHHMEEALALSH